MNYYLSMKFAKVARFFDRIGMYFFNKVMAKHARKEKK